VYAVSNARVLVGSKPWLRVSPAVSWPRSADQHFSLFRGGTLVYATSNSSPSLEIPHKISDVQLPQSASWRRTFGVLGMA
jgi:hypothetical protein